MDTFHTHSQIIDAWGPLIDFSRETGIGYEAVRAMHRRNSISPNHWPAIVEAARRRGIDGVSFEALARLREQRARSENVPSAAEGQGS